MSSKLVKLVETEFKGDLQDDAKRLIYTAIKNPRTLTKVVNSIIEGEEREEDDENGE